MSTNIKPSWIYGCILLIAIVAPLFFMGLVGSKIMFTFLLIFVFPYYLITRHLFSDITEQIIIAILLAFALNGFIMGIIGMFVSSFRLTGLLTFLLVVSVGLLFKPIHKQIKKKFSKP